MTGKLCLLCCENFRCELQAAIADRGWTDVTVSAFPAHCGRPPLDWQHLRPLVATDVAQAVIFGRACLQGLGAPPQGWPPVRLATQAQCFHLVAGPTMVAEAIGRDAYLLTPAWLRDWRGNLRRLGFGEANAADFFRDFAQELVLLDTGTASGSPAALAELAATAELPATRLAVGIDYTVLLLDGIVQEWRVGEERRQVRERGLKNARRLADHMAAMDFLGRLPLLKDEAETISAIQDMFRMLFAPQDLHYLRVEAGVADGTGGLPADLVRQLVVFEGDWGWTEAGTGFFLRITRYGEVLGIIVADRFAFPEFAERYLNLALSVMGACALAIENARTYRRIRQAEEALRKSEYSLRMAQAIAHIGHWEWDVGTNEMRWSDETYRILGFDPQSVAPSRDTFLQVIHGEDRERVLSHIAAAPGAGAFDLEYRIVLPDGRCRIVRGMGDMLVIGEGRRATAIGTIQEVATAQATEVLGVIEDITERKELEWRLAQEARTDALTGCVNRRHFLELADQELARICRYGGDLSVLMLDLDHFKAVNDQYGHHAGDLALRALAEVCRCTLRQEDVVGRIGGEEFAVLLPATGREKSLEVAERLRRAVAAAEVDLEGRPAPRVTVSIGAATVELGESQVEMALARADKALYRAKSAGRNRVEFG